MQLQCQRVSLARREAEFIFKDVTFSLTSGEALQISGANGCGKSSLLSVVSGLLPPTAGGLFWQGQTIAQQRAEYCRHLLYLGHKVGVKAGLTPMENLTLAGEMVSPMTATSALKQVGLSVHAHQLCGQLSAGQQQRVALARLWAASSTLWILDEPMTALDVDGVALLQSRLIEHVKGGGLLIFTTHQPLTLPGIAVSTLHLDAFACA